MTQARVTESQYSRVGLRWRPARGAICSECSLDSFDRRYELQRGPRRHEIRWHGLAAGRGWLRSLIVEGDDRVAADRRNHSVDAVAERLGMKV